MKILNTIIVATLVLLSSHTTTLANDTMTAKNVLQVCTTPDMHWIDFCNGFFQAVHDQQGSFGKVCAPAGITRTNLVEIYEKKATVLISNDATEGEKLAVNIAAKILIESFPCE